MDAIWVNCNGGPYTQDNPRGLSWGISRGWGDMINRLLPLAEGKLVMLHNPFGRTSEQTLMEFDQYFNCQRVAKHVTASFDQHIGKLVKVAESVVVYIGAPHNSQRMLAALAVPEAVNVDNWLYQTWYNLQPILDNGCLIGLDNMAGVNIAPYESSWLLSLQHLARSHNRDIWIEATTEYNSPLHDKCPMFILDKLFQQRHVNKTAISRFPNVTNSQTWYKNQIGVLIRGNDYPDQELLNGRLMNLRAWGCLPVLQFNMLES